MSKLIPLREMTIEQQQELSDIMGCNWVDVFCQPEDFAFEWSVGGSVETEIFSLPLSRILKAIQFFEDNKIDYKNPQKERIHEECVLNYSQLHKYFSTYLSTSKSVKELRNRGIVIGQKGLFNYLRKNGYLSEHEMSYNYPTYKGRANGRIVAVWNGSRGMSPDEKRYFTPHLAPGFINEIEKDIKEWLNCQSTKDDYSVLI